MKKFATIALVIALTLSLGTVVMAANTAAGDLSFHCGTYGGNGRVWIDDYEAKEAVNFDRIDDKTWSVSADYLCPNCWRLDWASFSNKSGVPSGKNIQVNHSDNARYLQAAVETYLVKIGLDGVEISREPVADYSKTIDITKENTGFGIDFPENLGAIEGFEFTGVTGIGNVPAGALTPADAKTYTVVYTYEEVEVITGGGDDDNIATRSGYVCTPCFNSGAKNINELFSSSGHSNCGNGSIKEYTVTYYIDSGEIIKLEHENAKKVGVCECPVCYPVADESPALVPVSSEVSIEPTNFILFIGDVTDTDAALPEDDLDEGPETIEDGDKDEGDTGEDEVEPESDTEE